MTFPQTVPYIGWAWDDLIFLLLGGTMLGAALLVVLGRNIIRSGLWMVLSFAALAGIYALLGATLVAAAQVLIYIGAISVLILFAIMLTQSKLGPPKLVFHHQAWAAAIASIVLAVLLTVVVLSTGWTLVGDGPVVIGAQMVAQLLFHDYILAFEVISVLLLAAVIGGVFLAKREPRDDPNAVDLTNPPAVPPLPIRRVIPAANPTPAAPGGAGATSAATAAGSVPEEP